MTALSLSTIVLALLGAVPGETAGWGTGAVRFKAYVRTAEHQEIYPVGAGQYTVEVAIQTVEDDPVDVLHNITNVDVCYAAKLNLTAGSLVEVAGTYYDGACPVPYCNRVQATSVTKIGPWEEPTEEESEEPPEYYSPRVITNSAEATETTATLQGLLLDDGGDACRVRFVYQIYEGPAWHTEWREDLHGGVTVTQKVAGLVPGTRYFFYVEAENSVGSSTGRQGSFVTLEEKVPPNAHPAVWLAAPGLGDAGSLTMTADIERDGAGPLEYFFDFVASPTGGAGGTDSFWQFSPTYMDLGLNPNQQYGYRVKARDGHGNETAYAPVEYAYTAIETPAGVAFGAMTTTSIQAQSSSSVSGLNRGQSGLKLENVTTGAVSVWQHDNALWTSAELLPNTRYTFRARARNGDGVLTPWGPEARVFTLAVAPSAPLCSDATAGQLSVWWAANGNPDGTQYLCQNTTKGTGSSWTTGVQWLETNLSPNTQYTYRVKARNGDGVETAFSAAASAYSAIETPAGVAFGTLTPASIQVRAQNTPTGLDRGDSGLWLENVTTGQTSLWRRDNSFWTSDSLLPNRRYGFRVRARNGAGVQTAATETACVYTQANVPTRVAFTGIGLMTIQVQWGTNGNPGGTLYLCENATAGTNCGWTADTTWTSTGLAPNTSYSFRVKARNGDGVETAWTDLGVQSTEYRSLTLSSTTGGKVSAPAQSVVRCAPGAIVNLVATPMAGYHFLHWSGTAVEAGRVTDPGAAQTTVLVDGQYTLVANFLRTQIFVDKRATGAKDGSTWANAFTSLQDALAAAQVGNEIWVAQGVYKPDVGKNIPAGDRTATFELPSNVAVKGGYAGLGKADPNARDLVAYETILSGDLKGDDPAVANSFDLYNEAKRTDNSLHVVSAWAVNDKTLLEGVTITAGNGSAGAGLSLIRSALVVSQCLFRANRTGQLSGDGLAGWGQGAGVSCYQSAPILRNCLFRSNWAGGQGGGVYSVESSPTLTNCTFQDNEGGEQGGALYSQDSNDVCVGCTFHANWSWDGGALYSDAGSATRATNCRFLGNAGHGAGGAVFAAGLGLEMTNCLFSGNLAFTEGGAAVLAQGSGLWTNCTFNRNVAEGQQTGQALSVRGAKAVLTNCILWDHVDKTPAQIAVTGTTVGAAELSLAYCDILGGAEALLQKGKVTVAWGVGKLNADPRFQNPDGPDRVAGTPDDDLHVKAGSPALDAGDNTAVPADLDDLNANGNRLERIPFDLEGRPRFVDDPATPNTGRADPPLYPGIVDLGACEYTKP